MVDHLHSFAFKANTVVTAAKAFALGCEPYVAGEIILFLSFRRNVEVSLIGKIVQLTRKLEASLQYDYPAYGGGVGAMPYLAPLAKFLDNAEFDAKDVVSVFLPAGPKPFLVKLLSLGSNQLTSVKSLLTTTAWGEEKLVGCVEAGGGLEVLNVVNLEADVFAKGNFSRLGETLLSFWNSKVKDGQGILNEYDLFKEMDEEDEEDGEDEDEGNEEEADDDDDDEEEVEEVGEEENDEENEEEEGNVSSDANDDKMAVEDGDSESQIAAPDSLDDNKLVDPFLLFHQNTMLYSRQVALLSNLLVSYSKNNPNNVDVLFDLAWVYTNPAGIVNSNSTGGGVDTSVVGRFLGRAVDLEIGDKQKVSERSERSLRKTSMRASERSKQQAKRAASEASSKRSEQQAKRACHN